MSKPFRRAICWVRRDLRLRDHAALARATELADHVAVVFVFDRNILDALEDRDDRRVGFIHESLREMDAKLRAVGSRLVVLHGRPEEAIPQLARELNVDLIVTTRDYEPYARERDKKIAQSLYDEGRTFETVKDMVIFEGGEILMESREPHGVYTPYSRVWRHRLLATRDAAFHYADRHAIWSSAELPESSWSLEALGFQTAECLIKPGEDAARERLRAFTTRLTHYREDRHVPAIEATSGLSVHLRFGTISIRECVRAVVNVAGEGAQKWLSELIWRDFYQDVLANHPRVVREPFQAQYRDVTYPGLPEHLVAWQEGRTGYPLVDAAMRCLRATGTMHNRLRMLVGSFLTKDLLIDYRQGEA